MTVERDEVVQELTRRLTGWGFDNPWSDEQGASTRMIYAGPSDIYPVERVRLHSRIVDDLRSATSQPARSGQLTVLVSAGPPGAGKSTALGSRFPPNLFRSIDADVIKDALLSESATAKALERFQGELLPDGRPVSPRELSAFVHAESTVVAAQFRSDCLADGENVLLHGTLGDAGQIDVLLAEFAQAGYDDLVIVDVEARREVAFARSLSRWWSDRIANADNLGGRFLPSVAFDRYYPAGPGRSICADNSQRMLDRARELGWRAALQVVDTSGETLAAK